MGHPQLDNLARIGKLKTEPAAETESCGDTAAAPNIRFGSACWI